MLYVFVPRIMGNCVMRFNNLSRGINRRIVHSLAVIVGGLLAASFMDICPISPFSLKYVIKKQNVTTDGIQN